MDGSAFYVEAHTHTPVRRVRIIFDAMTATGRHLVSAGVRGLEARSTVVICDFIGLLDSVHQLASYPITLLERTTGNHEELS